MTDLVLVSNREGEVSVKTLSDPLNSKLGAVAFAREVSEIDMLEVRMVDFRKKCSSSFV